MHLEFRPFFGILGLVAAAAGLAYILLGVHGLQLGEAEAARLLGYGLFAFVMGGGIWVWTRWSRGP